MLTFYQWLVLVVVAVLLAGFSFGVCVSCLFTRNLCLLWISGLVFICAALVVRGLGEGVR